MTTCALISTFALLVLVCLLFFRRDYSITKEGFIDYIVYGPSPWAPHRRHLWRRRWFRPYAWPSHAAWFY
jgi:hypothetical protein